MTAGTQVLATALVTGASRGIGEAVVRTLRGRGMDVYALALDDDDLRRVGSETGAHVVPLDIREIRSLEEAIGGVSFDVVVNNAGVLPQLEPFPTNTAEAIDLLVDVNLRAALHVTRMFAPRRSPRRPSANACSAAFVPA